MVLKTQGTQVYFVDPRTGTPVVLEVGCPTGLSGMGSPRDQMETTCLNSPARTYEAGLATPAQVTMNINFAPDDASHLRLLDLWQSGEKFQMAIGYSDGTAAPTGVGTDGLMDLPTTRSWAVLNDVYVADFPQDFQLNALVTASITIQPSGFPDFIPKA